MLGLLIGITVLCCLVSIAVLLQLWHISDDIERIEEHMDKAATWVSNEVCLQDRSRKPR